MIVQALSIMSQEDFRKTLDTYHTLSVDELMEFRSSLWLNLPRDYMNTFEEFYDIPHRTSSAICFPDDLNMSKYSTPLDALSSEGENLDKCAKDSDGKIVVLPPQTYLKVLELKDVALSGTTMGVSNLRYPPFGVLARGNDERNQLLMRQFINYVTSIVVNNISDETVISEVKAWNNLSKVSKLSQELSRCAGELFIESYIVADYRINFLALFTSKIEREEIIKVLTTYLDCFQLDHIGSKEGIND